MPRFEDAPLEPGLFRLFRFKPDLANLELEVRTFEFIDAPSYHALSYCWGEKADGTEYIVCNDESLDVGHNLWGALNRLFVDYRTAWHWCDAICIEQGREDVAVTEKLQQIPLMDTIFKTADPVLVWLGGASPLEEKAFQYLVDRCEKDRKNDTISTLPSSTDPIWRYWARILIRPWFSRVWVCQEALMNGGNVAFMLGRDAWASWTAFSETWNRTERQRWEITYDELDRPLQRAVDRHYESIIGCEMSSLEEDQILDPDSRAVSALASSRCNLHDMFLLHRYRISGRRSLAQIIRLFRSRDCTFDQDRPAAMKGLLSNDLKKGMKAYGPDTDVATVYRETTCIWLKQDPTFSVLHGISPLRKFLRVQDRSETDHIPNPSWVVDLSRTPNGALGQHVLDAMDGFHAGLVRSQECDNDPAHSPWKIPMLAASKPVKPIAIYEQTQCHIHGVLIGRVENVLSSTRDEDFWHWADLDLPTSYLAALKEFVNGSFDLVRGIGLESNAVNDAHWRTLVVNDTDRSENATRYIDVDDEHSRLGAYLRLREFLDAPEPKTLRELDHSTLQYYYDVFIGEGEFPNWWSTSTGHIGRSFCLPQPDDVIAVFYGASTPFLLHPVPGEQMYQLMGEAYCHGIMQGEALLKKNESRYGQRVFKLI
jgi:hypothetical protein